MTLSQMIREQSADCSARIHTTRLFRELADGTISRSRFVGFVAAMYPVVVTFPMALNKMLAGFDAVLTKPSVFANLLEQAKEELHHNQLWREMLEVYEVDHLKLYRDFSMPTPVYAMTQYQMFSAGHPTAHLACQVAMECTILDIVTKTIHPAVASNADLNDGKNPRLLAWWAEHLSEDADGKPTAEARHIRRTLKMVDDLLSEQPNTHGRVSLYVESTLRLFHACFAWHDDNEFDVREFPSSGKRAA